VTSGRVPEILVIGATKVKRIVISEQATEENEIKNQAIILRSSFCLGRGCWVLSR